MVLFGILAAGAFVLLAMTTIIVPSADAVKCYKGNLAKNPIKLDGCAKCLVETCVLNNDEGRVGLCVSEEEQTCADAYCTQPWGPDFKHKDCATCTTDLCNGETGLGHLPLLPFAVLLVAGLLFGQMLI